MAVSDDFMKLDIRAGTIVDAKIFEKARKPAYQLKVDFGEELHIKKSFDFCLEPDIELCYNYVMVFGFYLYDIDEGA